MIPAIVLAAGMSSRMGRAKAMLPTASGETFVRRMAATLLAGGADDVVVVVRPELADDVSRALGPVEARIVPNDHADEGQLSSVITALDLVDRPGVVAALITPVDFPALQADTVAAVIAAYRNTGAPLVRPAQGSRHGHPVLIDRALFGELRRCDPAQGMRAVVHHHRDRAVNVEVDDDGAFVDVDTPEQYRAVTGRDL